MNELVPALLIVIGISLVPLTIEFISYIKPQDDIVSECLPDHPCLTLGNCTQQQGTCFVSHTEFNFLPGRHQLDSPLSLENLTYVTLQGNDDPSNRSVIVFAPLAHINWTDCINISINHLTFLSSGTPDITHFFISMQFLRSVNVGLFAATFSGGQNQLYYSTAMRCYESSINISNSNFISHSSYIGAGIVGYSCSLHSHNNSFINNSAQIGGGAITLFQSKFVFTGITSFLNNRALTVSGGAIISFNSEVEMRGTSVFIRNSATGPMSIGRGGAILSNDGRLHISGNAYFIGNSADFEGGGICAHNTSVNLSGSIYFEGNAAFLGGGGMTLAAQSKMYGRGLYFIRNQYTYFGGGIYAYNSSYLHLIGTYFENNTATSGACIAMSSYSTGVFANITAIHNSVNVSGGAIYTESSTIILIGNTYLANNSARLFGGAIFTITSEIIFNGTSYITGNTVLPVGSGGGGLYFSSFSNATIGGTFVLQNNTVRFFGGGIFGLYSTITFRRGVTSLIKGNSAESGGAIYTVDCLITLTGHQSFVDNSAMQGGALALLGNSKLNIDSAQYVNFSDNRAESNGGAMFFADPISIRQCNKTDIDKRFGAGQCFDSSNLTIYPCRRLSSCFIELERGHTNKSYSLMFINNTAGRAGSLLYGGQLDDCRLYLGGATEDSCGDRIGGKFSENPIETLNAIFYIEIDDNNHLTSIIASDAFQVCFCEGRVPNCTIERSVKTVTGRAFSLSL